MTSTGSPRISPFLVDAGALTCATREISRNKSLSLHSQRSKDDELDQTDYQSAHPDCVLFLFLHFLLSPFMLHTGLATCRASFQRHVYTLATHHPSGDASDRFELRCKYSVGSSGDSIPPVRDLIFGRIASRMLYVPFSLSKYCTSPWDTLSPTVRVSHWGKMVNFSLVSRFSTNAIQIHTVHTVPLELYQRFESPYRHECIHSGSNRL